MTLFFVMIAAISSPNAMRSAALHVCVVKILMLPATEYPMAMTQKYWGVCFWSSMSLIWFLASILLGLSMAGIGGLTCIIRHCGSAVFSGFFICGVLDVVCLGCARDLWWALAATWAQDVWVGIGAVFFSGSVLCGCIVSGVMSMFSRSNSMTLLVRYALVSARLLMMCLSMLASPVPPMSFVTYVAQSAAPSLGQMWLSLAIISSSSMSSSFILIHSIVSSSSSAFCLSLVSPPFCGSSSVI